MLTANGTNFDNMVFEWGSKENLSLVQRADIDLKLSQMGFTPDKEYIQETYDVNVDNTEEKEVEKTKNALANLYGSSR